MENKLTSSLLEQVTGILHRAQSGSTSAGFRLKDWRIYLSRTETISLGIKNNAAGSVYSPPSAKNTEKAEIYLIWEDEKCSKAIIQNPPPGMPDYWNRELGNWRAAAFYDKFTAQIPGPTKFPEVELTDQRIHDIVTKDRGFLFEQQHKILDNRPRKAITNGHITAAWGNHAIRTSTGLNAEHEDSHCALSWSFDSIVGEHFAQRRLIRDTEWKSLWEGAVMKYDRLQNEGEPVHRDTAVILAPSVVSQMIDQYVLPNFRGENVIEGQSRFSRKDYLDKAEVADAGLTLEINPLLPEKWASYILTSEGVPAMRTVLIGRGRMETPYLNIKDAGRWESAPTAVPQGSAGILIRHERQMEWQELIGSIRDGILIISVLGLHTQNPVTGSFSLSAPYALRIIGGMITGKTDVRITGNFWDILQQIDTIYATDTCHEHPYLVYHKPPENL